MQVLSIYGPVREALDRVNDKFKGMANLRFPFLAQLLDHVFEAKGKSTRPAITLLAASFHPHNPQTTEIMAAAVELLHVATLIHDDTVDDSDVRRGRATISRLWGRNTAVLVGDYIFAASATFVCDTGNIRVIRRFSQTIMELSTGELQEMANAYNMDQTMEQYLDRIYNKTASLFTTAGESGAILSGATKGVIQALKTYSHNLGMAFQMVDDILDFQGAEQELGKPVGNDLAHGILTLPAFMSMLRYPNENPITTLFRNPDDERCLSRAVDMIQSVPVIEDSYSMAAEYGEKAREALKALPPTPSRESLHDLVEHVLTRRR